MKNKGWFLIIILFISASANAQSVQIESVDKKVDGKERTGFVSSIVGEAEKVENIWMGALKDLSKVRKRRNYYLLEYFTLPDFEGHSITAYSTFNISDSLSTIWIGYDKSEIPDSLDLDVDSHLENFLYTFTFEVHKSRVQEDIQRAERAVAFKSRENQMLIENESSLKSQLTKAENRKVQLEKLLTEISLEIEVLKQKIIDNKSAQEQTYLDLEQIKKVLEQHKTRLRELQ